MQKLYELNICVTEEQEQCLSESLYVKTNIVDVQNKRLWNTKTILTNNIMVIQSYLFTIVIQSQYYRIALQCDNKSIVCPGDQNRNSSGRNTLLLIFLLQDLKTL